MDFIQSQKKKYCNPISEFIHKPHALQKVQNIFPSDGVECLFNVEFEQKDKGLAVVESRWVLGWAARWGGGERWAWGRGGG